MAKRFYIKKAIKIPAASGVTRLSKTDEPRNPEEKEKMRKFVPGGSGGAHVDGDDDTA